MTMNSTVVTTMFQFFFDELRRRPLPTLKPFISEAQGPEGLAPSTSAFPTRLKPKKL